MMGFGDDHVAFYDVDAFMVTTTWNNIKICINTISEKPVWDETREVSPAVTWQNKL